MLAQAGRFDECWPRFELCMRKARDHGEREPLALSLAFMAGAAYLAGGASRVPSPGLVQASVEAAEFADGMDNRYLQIWASASAGLIAFLESNYGACESSIGEAIEMAHSSGTGLDYEVFFLAVLADCFLARGDTDAGIAKARVAIRVGDAGGAWFQAALARAVHVDALLASGAPASELQAGIDEAQALVLRCGGLCLQPRLREAQARLDGRGDPTTLAPGLRDAEAMYRAMGGPDAADRLARELAT
jgi:hypothetical protein